MASRKLRRMQSTPIRRPTKVVVGDVEGRIRARVQAILDRSNMTQEELRRAVGEVLRDELHLLSLPPSLVQTLMDFYVGKAAMADLLASTTGKAE